MFLDFVCEEFTDIVLQDVAACVPAFFLVLEKLLSSAFGNSNHGMRLAVCVTAFESPEESVKRKGNFWNKADVHDGRCKRCVRRDKARVTTHELHKPKAIVGTVSFDVRTRNYVCRTEHGGFKTERPVDQVQVVVDRLRDADNRDGLLTLLDFFSNSMCATERTVTTDAEQHVDVESHERIDHHRRILHSARASKNRAAIFLNGIDHIRAKHYRRVTVARVQSAVAVRDAEDVPHTVVKPEHLNKALNDIVKTRAEATAGHDACARPSRVMENCLARAGRLKRRNRNALGKIFRDELDVSSKADLVIFGNKRNTVHRGL